MTTGQQISNNMTPNSAKNMILRPESSNLSRAYEIGTNIFDGLIGKPLKITSKVLEEGEQFLKGWGDVVESASDVTDGNLWEAAKKFVSGSYNTTKGAVDTAIVAGMAGVSWMPLLIGLGGAAMTYDKISNMESVKRLNEIGQEENFASEVAKIIGKTTEQKIKEGAAWADRKLKNEKEKMIIRERLDKKAKLLGENTGEGTISRVLGKIRKRNLQAKIEEKRFALTDKKPMMENKNKQLAIEAPRGGKFSEEIERAAGMLLNVENSENIVPKNISEMERKDLINAEKLLNELD